MLQSRRKLIHHCNSYDFPFWLFFIYFYNFLFIFAFQHFEKYVSKCDYVWYSHLGFAKYPGHMACSWCSSNLNNFLASMLSNIFLPHPTPVSLKIHMWWFYQVMKSLEFFPLCFSLSVFQRALFLSICLPSQWCFLLLCLVF